ncbi:MAG: S-methyl-5'-thioadenosine phosphorylase [Oscillatoriales cyanobacterium]|nr:MAG: S-methyl-5'-thioadenosine phosphorylase [Oscillatoriales cyanobacterium]
MTQAKATIGILGGSGLYHMDALEEIEEIYLTTPFGDPSDAIVLGTLDGARVAFLARHGRGHHMLPSELPYRANIYAMKLLGVKYLISASAVGSLQEQVKPLDIVVPDQFIDRTKNRPATFFGNGVVAHITFGDPVCPQLARVVSDAARSLDLPDITIHDHGTYVCMEGPAFSTRAESNLYRSWGASTIGMTNLTEAKLAREAEIAYATMALVTDYDCWHDEVEAVSVEMVIENLHHNAENAQRVIREIVQRLQANPFESIAHTALKTALFTRLDTVDPKTIETLQAILQPYL